MFFQKENTFKNSVLKKEKEERAYVASNSDFEINTDYFDVIPDEKLLTLNLFPIYNVRFRTLGLKILAEFYKEKYQIDIKVEGIMIEKEIYSLSSKNIEGLLENGDNFFNSFNFNDMKENSSKGVIVNFVNKDKKLSHTSSFILNISEKKVKSIIILDYLFYFLGKIEQECLSIKFANYFSSKFENVKIYCHDFKFIQDQNSCSIFGIEIIRKILTDKKIIDFILNKKNNKNSEISNLNIFQIPEELYCLSQSTSQLNEENKNTLFLKKMLFKKIYNEYNPSNLKDFNTFNFTEKEINLTLHIASHLAVKNILEFLEQKTRIIIKEKNGRIKIYNPDYWISLFSNNKNKNFLKFIVRMKNNKKESINIKKPSLLNENNSYFL